MEEKIPETKRTNKLLLLVVILLSGFSCSSENVYDDYKMINRKGWHKDSTLVFNFDIKDTLSSYDLFLNIRNYSDYYFRNIWLDINIVTPDGQAEKEFHEIILADHLGNWHGSGIGDLCDLQVAYQSDILFPVPGNYQVSIKHKMKEPVLEGVRDMGFSVKKSYSGKK